MFQIVEKKIQLEFPKGHHLHCMTCHPPNELIQQGYACKLRNSLRPWQRILSALDLVAAGEGDLRKLHFLVFPEASLPYEAAEEPIAYIEERFPKNTETFFGMEHINLSTYHELSGRHAVDNSEVLDSVKEDQLSGDIDEAPVNSCLTLVKQADGRLRVFFQAKSHPFFEEETLDLFHNLYRGKIFPLFRCEPTDYNFMTLPCLDYVYRDLYQSNIPTVIEKTNELFHQTRQRLDLLYIIECNPKPEHQVFRDVINGFYGKYLAYTPGVRDTKTVFCNSSNETSGLDTSAGFTFGHSMIIMRHSHKIAVAHTSEFQTDNFDGLPVCRLRFAGDSRLYYFNLPLFHELDPRTTRFPLKTHAIYRPERQSWKRLNGISEHITIGEHNFVAVRKLDAADSAERTKRNHD